MMLIIYFFVFIVLFDFNSRIIKFYFKKSHSFLKKTQLYKLLCGMYIIISKLWFTNL